MEPPDVKPALGIRAPDSSLKFVPYEHSAAPHEYLKHVPLADRDYARYPPGTGPFFGGGALNVHPLCTGSLMLTCRILGPALNDRDFVRYPSARYSVTYGHPTKYYIVVATLF